MAVYVSLRIGTVIRMLIGLVFALMCIMAILHPERWLFLFQKGFTGFVVVVVLFVLYGVAGKLK